MKEVFGYGYVTKSNQNILKSTIYKALRGQYIVQKNIYIDILQNTDNKEMLKKLLSNANEGDTIIIMNRRAFGKTNDFRKWWNEITFVYKLNLLIVYNDDRTDIDYYSTTDFSLERYTDEQIKERKEKLETDVFEYRSNHVGRKTIEITSKFIETYWAYQAFLITVEDAYQHMGVSKQTFYTLCKSYEKSVAYKKDLKEHSQLFNYPRRGGISSEIEHLFFAVEQQKKKLKDACLELKIPVMSKEEYGRYLLAKNGGRKIQFKMEKEHHIDNYFKK